MMENNDGLLPLDIVEGFILNYRKVESSSILNGENKGIEGNWQDDSNGSSKINNDLKFEISDYVVNNIATIFIDLAQIQGQNATISLVNSSAAGVIILNLIKSLNKSLVFHNFIIQAQSQSVVKLSTNLCDLQVDNFILNNIELICGSKLFNITNCAINSNCSLLSTYLPTTSNKIEICINSSEDMLEVQKLLQGVNIIPGNGEYVYDTEIQWDVNLNNSEKIADATYNIKQLKVSCPNVVWISPVVGWFGVSNGDNLLDAANISIMPGVDILLRKYITNSWHVGGYDNSNAHFISVNRDYGTSNYGGTINDEGLIRYLDSLHELRYKIMLYPMIFMDVPGKPWRGHITCSKYVVHEFFTKAKGYNEFILHYAKLVISKVDAFVIGSELKSLTKITDTKYSYPDVRRYPTVVELIKLAEQVKKILGPEVVVTYAADWSEYHHDDAGYYHLDPLWASEYIDVIDIDAYFPLTDKKKGDITLEEIKKAWESGQLWDYYYNGGKQELLSADWGLKQISHWWSSEHWAWGVKSVWVPQMKPIWFTEFGFPSIHYSTNQPNIFWNPECVDSGTPKGSSTNPDFAIQMRAIRASLEYWQDKKDMVQNMFLWAWDVRPYPAYPISFVWSDRNCWERGHWINGKIFPLCRVVSIYGNSSTGLLIIDADEVIIDDITNYNNKIITNGKLKTNRNIQGKDLTVIAKSLENLIDM